MNTGALRLIGILFFLAAIITAILNLHRVADLGMPWLVPPLIILGLAFVVFARRATR
jgi:Flp pilus assembly protein protease CpaA